MAKITVVIDLPNVTAGDINTGTDWFENGMIIIDEAYLDRSMEDNSFFAFNVVKIEDDAPA